MNLDNLSPHQVNNHAQLLAAKAAARDGAPELALMILAGTIKVRGNRQGPSWPVSNYATEASGCAAVVYVDLAGAEPLFYAVPAGWLHLDLARRRAEAHPGGWPSPEATVELGHVARFGTSVFGWRKTFLYLGEPQARNQTPS